MEFKSTIAGVEDIKVTKKEPPKDGKATDMPHVAEAMEAIEAIGKMGVTVAPITASYSKNMRAAVGGMSQERYAEALGVSVRTVRYWEEKGVRHPVTVLYLELRWDMHQTRPLLEEFLSMYQKWEGLTIAEPTSPRIEEVLLENRALKTQLEAAKEERKAAAETFSKLQKLINTLRSAKE